MIPYSVKLTRAQVIDLFSDLSANKSESLKLGPSTKAAPLANECLAVWPNEGHGWPSTFVVSDDSITEFLAWMTTYARSFTPFTAHFRVMNWSSFQGIEEKPFTGALPLNGKRRRLAALALIFGEAFAAGQRYQKLIQMPLQSFKSTVSFPLNRALHLNLKHSQAHQILENALRLQYAGNHTVSPRLHSTLRSIWSILINVDYLLTPSLGSGNPLQDEVVRCLLENGILPEKVLFELAEHNAALVDLFPKGRDILEDRMNNINALLARPEFMRLREENRAVVAGYCLSRIAPGTLDHLSLLAELREHSPAMTIWYCFAAGCSDDSHIEIDNMGLGRLLSREISAPEAPFDYPRADISLNEFELMSSNNVTPEFPRSLPGSLTVEMYPRVYMVVRTTPPSDQRGPAGISGQEEALSVVQALLNQAQRAIARVQRDDRSFSKRKPRS
jgi:hypothetical protein